MIYIILLLFNTFLIYYYLQTYTLNFYVTNILTKTFLVSY